MRQFLLKLEKKFVSLHPRDQKILPYFTFICIFLIFYMLIISPLSTKTTQMSTDNSQMEQEAFSLKQKLEVLDTVKQRLMRGEEKSKVFKDRFQELKQQVPSQDEIARVLSHLADSQKVNFLIQSISERDYVETRKYTSIPLVISAAADFSHIIHFVKAVETSKRLMTISSIQISVDNDNPAIITTQFTVNTYKIPGLEQLIRVYREEAQEKKNEKNKKK
ncbi:MAG: type 4a pilus biogenesis protein PilO [Acidobacteria bacterium]|nr:type 4a pilus biogenesis protein PilO [Acidobacteriota bacterium]